MATRIAISALWITPLLAMTVACGSSGGADEATSTTGGDGTAGVEENGQDGDDGRPRRKNVGAPIKIPNFAGDYTRTASFPKLRAFKRDLAGQCGGALCVRLAPSLVEGDPPITDDCYVTGAEPSGDVARGKTISLSISCAHDEGDQDGEDGGPTDTPAEPSPTAGDE